MKKKLLGIFVSMLMLASIPLTAGTAEEPSIQSEMQVVTITRPAAGNLYIFDIIVIPIGGSVPVIIGPITFQATAQPSVAYVTWVVTDRNGNLCHGDVPPAQPPNFAFTYTNVHLLFGIVRCGPRCIITAYAQDSSGNPLGNHAINAIKIL